MADAPMILEHGDDLLDIGGRALGLHHDGRHAPARLIFAVGVAVGGPHRVEEEPRLARVAHGGGDQHRGTGRHEGADVRIERAAAPPCRKPLRACKSVQAGS